jgi:hypothetical protein
MDYIIRDSAVPIKMIFGGKRKKHNKSRKKHNKSRIHYMIHPMNTLSLIRQTRNIL